VPQSFLARVAVVTLAPLASLAAPVLLAAQRPTVTADLGLYSAYVWRGVTSTNRFVLEPDVTVALPMGRARRTAVTLGAWTNIEPTRYDGAADISPLGGAPGPAATSSQLWLEARRTLGTAAVTLGATRYLYPDVGDLSTTYATNELYVVASGESLLGAALSPSFGVYYDVQKVRGAYLEGALSGDVGVPVGRGRAQAVTLSATVGYSAGQGPDARGVQAAYFAHDGLTHAELAARTALDFGAIGLAPTAHLVLGRDALVRVTSPDHSHALKAWVGATLTWTR